MNVKRIKTIIISSLLALTIVFSTGSFNKKSSNAVSGALPTTWSIFLIAN